MISSYGQRVMTRPDGMLRPLHFPSLTTMDQWTADGRRLSSGGKGVRDLPRTVYGQFKNSGHEGAAIIGRLDQVIFHDDGNVEGWGWLIDDEAGQTAVKYLQTGALRHNSVDLAEVKVRIDWGDEDDDDDNFWSMKFDFVEWKIGATTLVGMPAFPNASAELTEELTAALVPSDVELTVDCPWTVEYAPVPQAELVASAATTVPYDDYFIPESDEPHKIIVDAECRVYGNLAMWGQPHRGFMDRLVTAPRPREAYREFNHPGPLTERGQVGTGPIFLLGGHAKKTLRGLTPEQITEAMGGVENAWADVRVSEGRHGPWVSGRLRPGLTDEQIHAARCSHISGHWIGDQLVAIASVSTPGFLPGAGFAFADEAGDVLELVASMPATAEAQPRLTNDQLEFARQLWDHIAEAKDGEEVEIEIEVTEEVDVEVLELELELDDA